MDLEKRIAVLNRHTRFRLAHPYAREEEIAVLAQAYPHVIYFYVQLTTDVEI